MNILFAIVCVLGATASIILVSSMELGGIMKAALIVPMVLIAVYSMARIPPKEEVTEKNTDKSYADEIFDKAETSEVL